MQRFLRLIVRLALAMTLAMTLTGCMSIRPASPTRFGSNDNIPDELSRVLRDYEKAWIAKDAAALAALFADDGFVLSNNSPPVRGRTNIQQHYQGAGGPLALRALAWRTQHDVGCIIGEFDQDRSFANPGKFTLTLVRDHNKRWLIFSDMDNGNTPPPKPAEAAEENPTAAVLVDRDFVIAAGMTEAEAGAWEAIADAAGKFFDLPEQHPMDKGEVASAIHIVQNKLLSRPTYRKYLEMAKAANEGERPANP